MLHEHWNYKGEKMLKNLSIENWILAGTSFILIFTLGCYLWFQNEISSIELQYTDHQVEIQHVDEPSDIESIKTPLIEINDEEESDTPENNSTDAKDTDVEISNVTATQSKNIERVKVTVKVTVKVPWREQTTVLKAFKLNI